MKQKESSLWDYTNESKWRDFREAREFARKLNLTGIYQWKKYIAGENTNMPEIPGDIPPEPDREYMHLGWLSWNDWLGISSNHQTKKNRTLWDVEVKEKWLSFEAAREFARSLDLEYQEDWEAYFEGKIKRASPPPDNMPANPSIFYRYLGWKEWKDWLIEPKNQVDYSPFEKAMRFVWCLRLSSKNDWFEYMRDENTIHTKYRLTIPKRPNLEYRDFGWKDWNEWLGFNIEFIPYDDVKIFIHKLKLKNQSDWRDYCNGNHYKHQKKTEKIPCYPDVAYKKTGWTTWEDWLGSTG